MSCYRRNRLLRFYIFNCDSMINKFSKKSCSTKHLRCWSARKWHPGVFTNSLLWILLFFEYRQISSKLTIYIRQIHKSHGAPRRICVLSPRTLLQDSVCLLREANYELVHHCTTSTTAQSWQVYCKLGKNWRNKCTFFTSTARLCVLHKKLHKKLPFNC